MPLDVRDPYDVLGVSRTATEGELREAFRRLAREHHPDQNPGDSDAQRRFQELNAAYQLLGDPQRRARYDRLGDTSRTGNGPSPAADVGGLEDLLRDLFGGFVAPRIDRGDIQAVLEISLEEAARGCTKTLRYRRTERCVKCTGSGHVGNVRCDSCHGNGGTNRERQIEVTVPAGIESDAAQTIVGAGNEARLGRPPGDLELVIRVRPDERFRREGDDVHSDVAVPFHVCALGGSIEVTTVYGTETLHVPAGTQHGDELRLRGRGVPHRFRGGQGDHFARVRMTVPQVRSERARSLVAEYDAAALVEDGLFDKVRSWFGE
jgi:molecular chaperone DnaJ